MFIFVSVKKKNLNKIRKTKLVCVDVGYPGTSLVVQFEKVKRYKTHFDLSKKFFGEE